MKKKSLPLSQAYRLLEPGPVVLLTTADAKHPNIMTMSWHMMIDFEPPLVGCVVSNRDYTFDILRKTKECVINIPTVKLAKQVIGCGNISGRNIDKFRRFGLTPLAASQVRAPLIDECFANLECKVIDTTMVDKYNIFILEVVKAWTDRLKKYPQTIHHFGHGNFMVAGRTIKLPSKMK
ncbi:MAG: flavin reductase family protein [Thaumarchaeota archaeon]|nr:flavin reductase family protein [Nitrososphaerota archaeon]